MIEVNEHTKLYFDYGNFDKWCIYRERDGVRTVPKDTDYFEEIVELDNSTLNNVYNDFIKIYDKTTDEFNEDVVSFIRKLARKYRNKDRVVELFGILYMGMIAEENKKNTILGKRIKRLGMYKVLVEMEDVETSANFMRGMSWREIDELCRERGF